MPQPRPASKLPGSSKQIARVRRMCLALPGATERLSHGEPTFFVHNRVFVMFANNHHNDGHLAVWLPVPPGMQHGLMESQPGVFFRPPYVGGRGWVGIELPPISDDDVQFHIQVAWEMIAPKSVVASVGNARRQTTRRPGRRPSALRAHGSASGPPSR